MKKYTRILAMLLSLVMVVSLCACGGGATTSEDEAGGLLGFEDETASGVGGSDGGKTDGGNVSVGTVSGTTVESKVEMSGSDPFANIPKRLKGTTVTFAHFGDEGAAEYQKVGKAFEKKTGIKVAWKQYNQEQYVAQVSKAIVGGAAPDIIICNSTFPAVLEIVQPLQNIIDLSDDFWDDEITEIGTITKKDGTKNSYLVNSLEGVWENTSGVFYNKQIFTNNGITSPADYYAQGKWSYENLKKCLEDVVKSGPDYIGGWPAAKSMNAQLGYSLAEYDPKTATFKSNADKIATGYTFCATVRKEGLWSNTAWWGTFAAGNIGLYSSGCYGAKYNGFFKDADANMLAAVPMPTSYQGKTLKQSASVRAYGISKGAKNPEGAAYFLRFYLDYEDYNKPAKAEIFKNKGLEKTFMVDCVKEIKKNGRVFEFDGVFSLSNTYEDTVLTGVTSADPAQVPALIAAQKNTIDACIKKANEKVESVKK